MVKIIVMNITTTLKNFGLTSNQTLVYLASLELGDAKAQDIAKKARVNRQTTYEVLESLATMGLVSYYDSRKVRRYFAEAPTHLERIIDSRRAEIGEIMPELKSIYGESGSHKPKIKYYSGTEEMKLLYEDTLTTSDKKLMLILSVKDLIDAFGLEYCNKLWARRIGAGIHIRVIRDLKRDVGNLWTETTTALRQLRYAPESFDLPLTMYLYDNKVVIFSTKHENFGMMIESKEFFQTQKALFEILWSVSEKPTR